MFRCSEIDDTSVQLTVPSSIKHASFDAMKFRECKVLTELSLKKRSERNMLDSCIIVIGHAYSTQMLAKMRRAMNKVYQVSQKYRTDQTTAKADSVGKQNQKAHT